MKPAGGGTSLYETSRLERCFRDVHACTQHIATSTDSYEAGGRVLVWDAKAMRERHRLEFGRRVAALAVTADGRQIAAAVVGQRAEFYVWETAKAADRLKPLHVDAGDYAGPIHAGLAFSPDGRRLAGTAYNAVWLNRLGELIGRVHVWERAGTRGERKPPE